ncbi:amidohydrolase, partial [Bacteroidota bacterium]
RRDFHQYAESGWTEFRTASLVARRLIDLGYEVMIGKEVMKDEDRMGLPDEETLAKKLQRAKEQGGDEHFLESVKNGFTGVVGITKNGDGPVIGLRFDMDALDIQENLTDNHRPYREGFASVNGNVMHACGHDGHTAAGLGIAEILMTLKNEIKGTVKLLFQPAEEGVMGAKSMVMAGVVDDVDFLLGHHVMSGWKLGEIISGMGNYAATQKFDAMFTGKPAHAGGSPEKGNNALLAASTAILNLYAIPRHSEGYTRINVGKLNAGTGRNVICSDAHLLIETRGEIIELNDYMYEKALTVLKASAEMYDCKLEIKEMGGAQNANSDIELSKRIEKVANKISGFTFFPSRKGGGSEDITYMMKRVQENGGLAANVGIGADLNGISINDKNHDAVLGAHTSVFDFDEKAIPIAMKLLSMVIFDIMKD